MDIIKQIKDLTLSFFKTIDAEINENNGLYSIGIPQKYYNYFQKSDIQITFDEKIAEENNCELIIPGSKTLFQIITNCNNKGPISIKQSTTGGMTPAILYHFYINFSGVKHYSKLTSVVVNLQNMDVIDLPTTFKEIDLPSNFKLISEKITPTFNVALKEVKQKTYELQSAFVNDANIAFENDFKSFISRYDDEIHELDESINQKEITSKDSEKVKTYRFDTLEKIQNLEKQKKIVLKSLEEKHGIDLNFELIACEILFC
jgi:hypothetical protein